MYRYGCVCVCVCVLCFFFVFYFWLKFGFWVYSKKKNRCGNRACIIEVDEHLRKSFLQFDRAPKRCACVASVCVCKCRSVCVCDMSVCLAVFVFVFPIAFEYVLENIATDGLAYMYIFTCMSVCLFVWTEANHIWHDVLLSTSASHRWCLKMKTNTVLWNKSGLMLMTGGCVTVY
jgi:hypothetical protein